MNEDEREELLERIKRKGAPIGHSIPESVSIRGTEMNLREFVFETKSMAAIPPQKKRQVKDVKRKLRAEREDCERRLETAQGLSREEGKALADKIVGIDRALNALEDLRTDRDLGEEAREREIDDAKRWVGFIDQIADG